MSHSVEVPASVSSIFMLEHQKNTVNCVASGKEEHVTVTDVYEMSQTENNRYRWKHAFQCKSFNINSLKCFLDLSPNLSSFFSHNELNFKKMKFYF